MKDALLLLIVEDNDILRDLLREDLAEMLSANISVAVDGEDALKLTQIQAFDIIFTDFEMPRMDGVEFVKLLRSTQGINQEKPVIFYSGYIEKIKKTLEAEKVLNLSFVEKPIPHEFIKDLILKLTGPKL